MKQLILSLLSLSFTILTLRSFGPRIQLMQIGWFHSPMKVDKCDLMITEPFPNSVSINKQRSYKSFVMLSPLKSIRVLQRLYLFYPPSFRLNRIHHTSLASYLEEVLSLWDSPTPHLTFNHDSHSSGEFPPPKAITITTALPSRLSCFSPSRWNANMWHRYQRCSTYGSSARWAGSQSRLCGRDLTLEIVVVRDRDWTRPWWRCGAGRVRDATKVCWELMSTKALTLTPTSIETTTPSCWALWTHSSRCSHPSRCLL